jgi:hypothetical protein
MRVGHVARIGERKSVSGVLVGKSDGKRPVGKPRSGWENNIKTDLQEIRKEGPELIGLVQDWDRWWAGVNTTRNHRVTQNAGHYLTS